MGFTPGPWNTARQGDDTLVYSDFERHPVCGAQHYIATCIHNKDDARLIAAAPDLLAALEGLLEHDRVRYGKPCDEFCLCKRNARAVIARATSETEEATR